MRGTKTVKTMFYYQLFCGNILLAATGCPKMLSPLVLPTSVKVAEEATIDHGTVIEEVNDGNVDAEEGTAARVAEEATAARAA